MSTKRILLVWNGDREEVTRVVSELRKDGYEVVYLITNEKKYFDIPGVVVHIDDDARMGVGAPNVDTSTFIPPGADLIRSLYKTESLILTMMNRKVERRGQSMTVDEKKRLYYELVRYWNGVLEAYKPDCIIFPAVPHNVSNFVLYALARLRSVSTILFQESWASDRILLQHEYDKQSPFLLEALKKNEGKDILSDELAPDLKEYYEAHNSAKDTTPFDVVLLKGQFDFFNRLRLKAAAFIRSILDFSVFNKVRLYVMRQWGNNLKKEYARYVSSVKTGEEYIYVPLHWQPECTTSPLGDMFVDQILMVETLSASVPSDWLIYVKEHPFQWSVDGVTQFTAMRYEGYYRKLAGLKNVRLVPIETNSYALLAHAKAVATITGRAGLEGVFRGVPALVFGTPWYQGLPGTFMVQDVSTVRAALTLIQNGFTVNQKEVRVFLKSFGESTIRGYMEPLGVHNSSISREESVQHILGLMRKGLQRLS